jgi:predicted amidohydrolase YtcJ
VLNKDIFSIHPEEIDEIKVLETYSGGEKIFSLEERTKVSG